MKFRTSAARKGTGLHHQKMATGDLVVMSIETYESMMETAAADAAIIQAEAEYAQSGSSLMPKKRSHR